MAFTAVFVPQVLPSYGRMAVEEQRLEGRFRAAHANLIHNAEMVAFMRGERPERKHLEDTFDAVRRHVKSTLVQKLYSNSLTGYVNKYFASVVGFALVSARNQRRVPAILTSLGGRLRCLSTAVAVTWRIGAQDKSRSTQCAYGSSKCKVVKYLMRLRAATTCSRVRSWRVLPTPCSQSSTCRSESGSCPALQHASTGSSTALRSASLFCRSS